MAEKVGCPELNRLMRCGRKNSIHHRWAVPDPGQPTELECDAPVTESRALITLAPMIESFEGKIAYRHTPFLAQLVATKQQHPQTRERRRAEPDVALAAYRATAALTHS
jgi:hypothetical protein